jgi:hypothetical protein
MPEYRLIPGSVQDRFGHLRTKVQIFGGGFGNGKTAAAVVQKALRLAKEYPGSNGLIARATYPKLNDTIRKEFLKWCPQSWIKSFPLSKNADNTCHMKNGTTINFRYVAQQGKSSTEDGGQTTSNLLSATYDWIIVDQLEDPEITEKDFNDLLGRLRGNARYIGNDPSMPLTGPRWFIGCVNPTRNWVYRKLVAPLKKYEEHGIVSDELLCLRHPAELPNGAPNPLADKPILDENGKPQLLISLVEGSTYTNSHNLGEDFIATLESAYRGQSRDRFLYGHWAAYEGLVHPDFDEMTHCLPRSQIVNHFNMLVGQGYVPRFVEGYDFGIAEPSCYLFGFSDNKRNIFIVDGFYKPEADFDLEDQKKFIWEVRNEWGCEEDNIMADPAIFRRTQVQKNTGAKTIAALMQQGQFGVKMRAADNEILRGITKVNMYLTVSERHMHPIHETFGAPHIFFAQELDFIINEATSYFWKTDTSGKRLDEPIDKNDHAMNTLKYMLSKAPELATRLPNQKPQAHLHSWREQPDTEMRSRRYG